MLKLSTGSENSSSMDHTFPETVQKLEQVEYKAEGLNQRVKTK
jgi:hypothetical protein